MSKSVWVEGGAYTLRRYPLTLVCLWLPSALLNASRTLTTSSPTRKHSSFKFPSRIAVSPFRHLSDLRARLYITVYHIESSRPAIHSRMLNMPVPQIKASKYGDNFDLPFRGLPAEIRMMIWSFSVPEVIKLRKVQTNDQHCACLC